jgi:hypothetical protein
VDIGLDLPPDDDAHRHVHPVVARPWSTAMLDVSTSVVIA